MVSIPHDWYFEDGVRWTFLSCTYLAKAELSNCCFSVWNTSSETFSVICQKDKVLACIRSQSNAASGQIGWSRRGFALLLKKLCWAWEVPRNLSPRRWPTGLIGVGGCVSWKWKTRTLIARSKRLNFNNKWSVWNAASWPLLGYFWQRMSQSWSWRRIFRNVFCFLLICSVATQLHWAALFFSTSLQSDIQSTHAAA